MTRPMLELDDIQGDIVVGLQKYYEIFLFFKIVDPLLFKRAVRLHVISRITSARVAHRRELILRSRKGLGRKSIDPSRGLNVGFTKDGLTQIFGAARPALDPSFERGADHQDTIEMLNDPPRPAWILEFISDRIDGVLLITAAHRSDVTAQCNEFLRLLGAAIKVVYSAMGTTRPGAQRGFEHFGYRDGISQPGIRGLTRRSRPATNPYQGLPGRI